MHICWSRLARWPKFATILAIVFGATSSAPFANCRLPSKHQGCPNSFGYKALSKTGCPMETEAHFELKSLIKIKTRTLSASSKMVATTKVSVIAPALWLLLCLLATPSHSQQQLSSSPTTTVQNLPGNNIVAQQQQQQQVSPDQAAVTQNSISQPSGQQQASPAIGSQTTGQLAPAPAETTVNQQVTMQQQQQQLASNPAQLQPRLPKINIFIGRTEMKKLLGRLTVATI